MRPVTLGSGDGDRTEILSGLTPGDAVVTDGVDKLQEGSRVSDTGTSRAGRGANEDTR